MKDNKLYENINLAQNMRADDYWDDSLNCFNQIYPFTTENLDGYMSKCNIMDKDVLTVGSSCDQIFNYILYGAKNITSIDVNPFVKYYFELKKAGIKALTKDEFLKFFCYEKYDKGIRENKEVFNINTFFKLYPLMDKEARDFWRYLYSKFDEKTIRNKMFSETEERKEIVVRVNAYLKEENYNKLKEIIDNVDINFINKNIQDKIEGKYDIINLSNISSYLYIMYKSLYLKSFKKDLMKLTENLKENGKIYMSYLYDINIKMRHYKEFGVENDVPEIIRLFGRDNIDFITFPAIEKPNKNKDMMMVLKKH